MKAECSGRHAADGVANEGPHYSCSVKCATVCHTMSSASVDALGPYRLDVLARGVADIVTHIGGWLIDRALAGWALRAVLAGRPGEVRALRILGLRDADIHVGLAPLEWSPPPKVLAVETNFFDANESVRGAVLDLMRESSTTVMFWGDDAPQQIGLRLQAVTHHLTHAAAAFKVHAHCVVRCAESTPLSLVQESLFTAQRIESEGAEMTVRTQDRCS